MMQKLMSDFGISFFMKKKKKFLEKKHKIYVFRVTPLDSWFGVTCNILRLKISYFFYDRKAKYF